MLWHKLPKSIYFYRGSLLVAPDGVIIDGHKRALIVIDRFLLNNGYADQITSVLKAVGAEIEVFFEVEADPILSTVRKSAELANSFKPDVAIVLGGGSPMDAVKIMWVMHEHLGTHSGGLALRFMDTRRRICEPPKMGVKAKMIAVTTTSGTGSEVIPFAVITDGTTGRKYPLADYVLTPDIAIVDVGLVMDMLKSLRASGGLDVVTHVTEAYVSVLASESSDGQALQALKLLKGYLPASYHRGSKNPVVRERAHSAAIIVGTAFTNAFLGVCYSVTHRLGSQSHIPYGLANALLICNVICYNANDNPTKQIVFSQCGRPQARRHYAEIADRLGLNVSGDRTAAKIEKLLARLETLKAKLGIPKSICETGVQGADFPANVNKLSEDVFDDQYTGANPRYPPISELKQILLDTYHGRDHVEGEATAKKEAAPAKIERKAKRPVQSVALSGNINGPLWGNASQSRTS